MIRGNKKSMLIGILSGFLNGLFGSGGGTVFVPASEKFMHLEEKKAHATAIALILPLTILSAFIYIPKTEVPWKMVIFLIAGGLLGGYLGASLLNRLSGKIIHIVFGIFMLIAAYSVIKRGFSPQNSTGYTQGVFKPSGILILWVIFTGFFSGIISGMGVGGGTILIPALLIFFSLDQKQSQAVNLIYFIPTAIIALLKHKKNKNIEKKILKPIIITGLIGSGAGSLIALNTENNVLKIMFGFFLVFMGIRELFISKGKHKKSG